ADRRWLAIAFASDDDLHLVHDPQDASGAGGISGMAVKSFDYMSRFARLGVRYRHAGLTVTPWLGVDAIDAFANHDGDNKGYSRFDIHYGLRAQIDREAWGGVLSLGFTGQATNYDYAVSNVPPPQPG